MVTEAALIFAAQFAMVMLLGLQSLNVNGRHYAGAAATSLLLGVCGYHITATIAAMNQDGFGSTAWWAFIIAGPCGIVTSIWLHPRLRKLINDRK